MKDEKSSQFSVLRAQKEKKAGSVERIGDRKRFQVSGFRVISMNTVIDTLLVQAVRRPGTSFTPRRFEFTM